MHFPQRKVVKKGAAAGLTRYGTFFHVTWSGKFHPPAGFPLPVHVLNKFVQQCVFPKELAPSGQMSYIIDVVCTAPPKGWDYCHKFNYIIYKA